MRASGLVIAMVLSWITSTLAQDSITASISANAFYDRCSVPADPTRQLYCLGYVAGTSDALNLVRAVCTPENVRTSETMGIIVNYLRLHPERQDMPATLVAGAALREAFPCK
jgi:Ssp1 endopeptidase immunity protein Rap1a